MPKYRFMAPAQVCFTIEAATEAEATAKASTVMENITGWDDPVSTDTYPIEGLDQEVQLDYWPTVSDKDPLTMVNVEDDPPRPRHWRDAVPENLR